jgi:hypothetical protein
MQLDDKQRYCTPQELLDLVVQMWPSGISTDPCWDPESLVVAEHKLDARTGVDGLIAPWTGPRCYTNPPYDQARSWLLRCLQFSMASPNHEVLCLVNAAVGSDYWREYVWPHAAVCCLAPRVKFWSVSQKKWSPNPVDSAMVYYGPNKTRFAEVFGKRGTIVSMVSPVVAAA